MKLPGPVVFAWRWFSGHAMHGRPMTNAGWFAAGDRAMTPTGRAFRWHYLPRAYRATARTGGTATGWGILYGLDHEAMVTVVLLAVTVTGLAVIATRRGVHRVRTWRHFRSRVQPLHWALTAAVGHPPTMRPGDWLDIPADYAKRPDAKIVVTLPDDFKGTGDDRQLVKQVVVSKLNLEDASVSFQMAGKPRAIFSTSVPPPDKVPLASVAELVAAADPTAPLLGIGRNRKIVTADLDNDSPHVMFSMGSGAGKSVATRLIAAQVLHNGGVALVLDVKRISHTWARGLPNVRYCRSIEDIHEGCLWLREEIDKRNLLVDEGADLDGNTDQVDMGPRLIVLAEEMNATVNRLRAYWRQIKEKGDPTESPAVEALGDALFMGRAVRVNVEAVAQMFSARTAGGPEARENMGTRVLGRYTMNNWRMLVPEIWPMPKSSRKPGRVQVCSGGTACETQIVFSSPKETREMALSGVVTAFPGTIADPLPQAALPAVAKAVGLAEAVRSGLLPITLDAARKARQRDSDFPEPVRQDGSELLYDPADLRVWVRNRPRELANQEPK